MNKPFSNFLANIKRYTVLTPKEEEELCGLLLLKTVKRKQLLLREGEVCSYEYYVHTGCLRTYYTDGKGTEHNLYFAVEDWWISDLYSRTTGKPAHCTIAALEDSEVIGIRQDDLEAFMTRVPAMERFFRKAYQQALIANHLRSLRMLSMNGQERYKLFREQFPELAGRVPQKHIATYLGLTPEFFNTIHARVWRQD